MHQKNLIAVLTTALTVAVAPLSARSAAVDAPTLAKYDVNRSGGLQPIAVDPDGKPSSYRIVAPRQFILSASFDL